MPVDPSDNNSPLSKYKWWIVGGLGLALAAGAGVMLKNSPPSGAAASGDGTEAPSPAYPTTEVTLRSTEVSSTPTGQSSVLQGLKDEMFELETDRAAGRITPEQYAEQKAAFDVVLRRALSRIES